MNIASIRLGFRLARREARRHPWRWALVVLMVVIPTFGMTAVATAVRTGEWNGPARAAAEYGQADVVAYPTVPTGNRDRLAAAEDRLRAGLPDDTVTFVHSTADRVRTDDRRAYISVLDLPIEASVSAGRFATLDGRAPTASDEVVLTVSLADELDLAIGDALTPQVLGRRLTVVGIVEQVAYQDHLAFVTDLDGAEVSVEALIERSPADGPMPQIEGWTANPTQWFGASDDDGDGEAVFWTYLGGAVALFALGTVIAAAFAVGARRQLRSIGLLSATGASPPTVRAFLLAQGMVGGALGSLLGIGLAMVAARLVPEAWIEFLVDRPVDGPVVRLGDLVPILVIGTLAAVGAAWLPARSAARVPTMQALAGRRPQGRVPRRLPALGALAIVGGCGLLALAVSAEDTGATGSILIAITGSVAVLAGALAIGPWVVAGLEHFSARWPESARLAGRSIARSRLRSSAVIGAMCAVMGTTIAGATLYRTFDADDADTGPYVAQGVVVIEGRTGRPAVQQAAAEAAGLIAGAELVELRSVWTNADGNAAYAALPVDEAGPDLGFVHGGENQIAAATPAVLDLFDVPAELRQAVAEGAAIAVQPVDDVDELTIVNAGEPGASPTIEFGGSFDSASASSALPTVLLDADRAVELGLVLADRPHLAFDVGRPLTDQERKALELFADDISWEDSSDNRDSIWFSMPEEEPVLTPTEIRAIGYGVLMLLIGSVVAVGLALAAKDDKDEAQVLVAVGAPPRTIRRVAALRAGMLVATAVAISLPAGLLPASAMAAATRRDAYDGFEIYRTGAARVLVVPDWPTLLFIAVVVPLAVMTVTLFSAWMRDLVRSSRPEVFAFAE